MLTRPRPNEAEALHHLYQSLVGQPHCPWTTRYPTRADAALDIAAGRVWVMRDAQGTIQAAISVEEDEVAPLFCPDDKRPSLDLCRVAVRRDQQGKGLACRMAQELFVLLRQEGYQVIRLLVRPDNPPAMATYRRLGFVPLGECDLYDQHFLACALELA